MKKHTFLLVGAVLASACVVGGLAQAPSGAPKPGPEHQKLTYFAGKWVSEGETKASAFGPAMKFSFVETCEWFSGGFAIVCHSEGKMGEGAVKGLSVMGYDAAEKSYVYFETNNLGENVFSRGSAEGGTWTWNNEGKMEGKAMRGRFTLRQISPDSATFQFEMGAADEPLKLVMEGKQTRQK